MNQRRRGGANVIAVMVSFEFQQRSTSTSSTIFPAFPTLNRLHVTNEGYESDDYESDDPGSDRLERLLHKEIRRESRWAVSLVRSVQFDDIRCTTCDTQSFAGMPSLQV